MYAFYFDKVAERGKGIVSLRSTNKGPNFKLYAVIIIHKLMARSGACRTKLLQAVALMGDVPA